MDAFANPGIVHLNPLIARSRPGITIDLLIHRYLPVAAIYFFFNGVGLPPGLFYTTVFSPLLYLWLYLEGRHWLTAKFLLVMSPFILAHMVIGVASPLQYLRSLSLWWTVYITVCAFCWALMKCRSIDRLFEQLIVLNFCATLLALAVFPTSLRYFFWLNNRLNLLSIEPSGYANLMLPLLVFTALRLLRDNSVRNLSYLMMIALPFLLCQSLGGIVMGLAGIGISLMTGYRQFLHRSKSQTLLLYLAIATCALLLTPNPISARILQAAAGNDSSTNSRTINAYIAAYAVAAPNNMWWGLGLGQTKFIDLSYLGLALGNGFPNIVSYTFAEFGLIGLLTVLMVELYLFFRTRVYLNSFRLAMFVVAFFTQFTGSYPTSVQLYMIWFFAFYPIFPDFNLRANAKPEVVRS